MSKFRLWGGRILAAGILLSSSTLALQAGEKGPDEDAVTFLDLLAFGREINIVLGVLLFASIFLVLRVGLSTRRGLTVPSDLLRGLLDDLASGDIEAAQRRSQEWPSILSATVQPGLKLHGHPPERIHVAMEGAGRRAIASIRQQVTYLSNIGVLSPMLGLLGTVIGLTKAFNVFGQDGTESARTSMMTASIGEAMGTTAVGLIVGISAMAAYYICQSRLGRIGDDVEIAAEEIYEALAEMHDTREGRA